jgi:hypothetical protein
MVLVEVYGGAVSRAGHPDTAAFSARKAEYDIGIFAQWMDAADSDANIAWAREGWKAIRRHASDSEEYVILNFNSDIGEGEDRAMFGENYQRLLELKAKYDPSNFFDPNRNAPSRAAGRD